MYFDDASAMPTLEHEADEMEELFDTNDEILEEDDTNTIIMGDWNSVVGDNHITTLLDHMA